MKLEKVLLYGFIIWVILFFVGWFLMVILPNTMNIIMLILGALLIYTFSRVMLDERNMFAVGIVWLLVNFLLDLALIFFILGNESYFSVWSIWVFYALLIVEPAVVKKLSKE